MMFCPKCGTTLAVIKKEEKIVQKCSKCGYETKKRKKSSFKIKKRKEKIVVVGEREKRIKTLPTVKIDCRKCGNKEAEYWMVQTRSADEAMTQFFRCTKCQHTWRETS